MRTSHLFLTLEQYLHVAWQGTITGQQGFQGQDLGEVLPFIVTHPTRIKASIAYRWLKRRRNPFLQGIRRLNIVVSIKQDGRQIGPRDIFAKDHRPASSRQDLHRQTNFAHNPGDIVSNRIDPLTIGADTRTPQVVDQAVEELLAMCVNMSECVAEVGCRMVREWYAHSHRSFTLWHVPRIPNPFPLAHFSIKPFAFTWVVIIDTCFRRPAPDAA